MKFSPERAAIRFGYGLSPLDPPPASVAALLAMLRGPDLMAARFPLPDHDRLAARIVQMVRLRRERRKEGSRKAEEEIARRIRILRREAADDIARQAATILLRRARSAQGFRERLVAFWADHFTVAGKTLLFRGLVPAFAEEAIRPHIAGSFEDMLIAAVTHPMMLHYLDQASSIGPNSPAATRTRRARGLNENLAREILELHTLGVDGPYGQQDVRQFAELLTGMTLGPDLRFRFRPAWAEPGVETVLGREYGAGAPSPEAILAALRDLARHPATARHIARKLAVHFVADTPPEGLVGHLEQRFAETGGDLMAVYAALLEYPDAWLAGPGNVKPPADFVASAMRALAVKPDRVLKMAPRRLRMLLLGPMARMGQPWQTPAGPNGWPEEDAAWITPQGLAARLRWAMRAPALLRPDLPDPRDFVSRVLGPSPGKGVIFAAQAAETRAEAIGLVLASPAFQRR